MSSTAKRASIKHKAFKKHKQDLSSIDCSEISPEDALSDLEPLHEISYKSLVNSEQPILVEKLVSSPSMDDLLLKISNYENIFQMIRALFELEKKRLHPDIVKEANSILNQIELENIDLCDRETRPSDTPVASTGDSFLDRLMRDPHLLETYFDKITTELAEQDLEIKTLTQQLRESEIYIDQLYASNQTLKEELFKKEKSSQQLTIIKRELHKKTHRIQKSCGQFDRCETSKQQSEYLVANRGAIAKGKTNSNLYEPHSKITRRILHY